MKQALSAGLGLRGTFLFAPPLSLTAPLSEFLFAPLKLLNALLFIYTPLFTKYTPLLLFFLLIIFS